MNNQIILHPIGTIHTPLTTKFGVPRQSGLAEHFIGTITLAPEYRSMDCFRGLEEFSHLWLLWQFSGAVNTPFSPTVRPPRLGGNQRKGVFATRSPFRPNHIGLSCVKLLSIDSTPDGPVLRFSGADMMDGTPLLDIKPYIPYADAHPEATQGFTQVEFKKLQVEIPPELAAKLSEQDVNCLRELLEQDPRPAYQVDGREYGMDFQGYNVKFVVNAGVAEIIKIEVAQ